MQLDGSTVVITGASAGVGRAAALAFARRGCRLGLIARDEEALQEVAEAVERLGGQALVQPADVADADAIDAAAAAVERELGPIAVWVNAAMVTIFAPVAEISAEEFRRVTEVTYLGQVHGTMAALARMRPRDRGIIVHVGSALAYRAIPLQAPYCGAKHALRGFVDSLRSELIHDRSAVRLTMVQLPGLNTPQFDWSRNRLAHRPQPVPPVFQPEVAARAVVRAAEQAPRELWVGRSSLQIIAGSMIAPGLLDRKLARAAYAGQQTEEPAKAFRSDNLYYPVHDPHRTHGRFDKASEGRALQVSSGTARGLALSSAVGLLVGAAALGWAGAKRVFGGAD